MRDLDKDPIQDHEHDGPPGPPPPLEGPMFGDESESLIEMVLSKITWGNFLVICAVILVCGGIFITGLGLGLPAYNNYLETEAQANAVRWAETHAKIARTLPEGTDLNEYILYSNLRDKDIESFEK